MSEEERKEARKVIMVSGGSGSGESDAEELRKVLQAVSEFLSGLEKPISKLINMILDTVSGEKVGQEVASLYRQLVDSGMPAEVAVEMAKEFFRKRMAILDTLTNLAQVITYEISDEGKKKEETEEEEEEEEEE